MVFYQSSIFLNAIAPAPYREVNPLIDIGLELLQAGVELAPERGGIELILNGLMKAFQIMVQLKLSAYHRLIQKCRIYAAHCSHSADHRQIGHFSHKAQSKFVLCTLNFYT
jgi:hypothetical protein